ncbi:hypothetical protein [Microbulbifer sp. THAF38]|uniref:hypothetical protein n=1 Tax=Microbulbifer sp. THAF38 TaxID=2587856 RepID=UPI001268918F|nr:hypothetical protein [Microbulbifer sp. THAF38]QFT57169.1 hypothetical protein FIU95_21690 [Microbulbifer sp. THAF38]
MSSPLNINLIIPFKDNKTGRLNLYRNEIEWFKENLAIRVEDLKEELTSLFGEGFELTLAPRSDGNSRKYYWRFKSSKRDRKYNRLHTNSVVEYVGMFDEARKLRLKEIEEELIYINANLKLIKGMLDSIDQSVEERAELRKANI